MATCNLAVVLRPEGAVEPLSPAVEPVQKWQVLASVADYVTGLCRVELVMSLDILCAVHMYTYVIMSSATGTIGTLPQLSVYNGTALCGILLVKMLYPIRDEALLTIVSKHPIWCHSYSSCRKPMFTLT